MITNYEVQTTTDSFSKQKEIFSPDDHERLSDDSQRKLTEVINTVQVPVLKCYLQILCSVA